MSEIRPEDWSDIQEALRHDLEAGRGDRARLTELLARLDRAPEDRVLTSATSGTAPITDRIDVAEVGRAHERIRAARSRTRAVAAVAGVIVAAGVLGIAYRSLSSRARPAEQPTRQLPSVQALRDATVPPVVAAAPPPVVKNLTVEHSAPAAAPPRRVQPSGVARVVDDDVEIAPAPKRVVQHEDKRPMRLVQAPRRPSRPKSEETATLPEPKRVVSARTQQSHVEEAAKRPLRVARSDRSPSVLPHEEFVPQPPPARRGPETASFTPMSKERVLPETTRASSQSHARDYGEARATPRIPRGNFDDRPGEERWSSYERDESRRRTRAREPLVERRICIETGMLAGDLCPHTAIVALPASRVPRRVCRVHAFP